MHSSAFGLTCRGTGQTEIESLQRRTAVTLCSNTRQGTEIAKLGRANGKKRKMDGANEKELRETNWVLSLPDLYRGSNMPYKGLKLIPVHRSTAAPKSMILTSPSAVMRMFSGLMSRCTMPRACKRFVAFSVCLISDLMISSSCFCSSSLC